MDNGRQVSHCQRVTNIGQRKARMYLVVLDRNWRDQCDLVVFLCIDTETDLDGVT